MKKDEAIQWIRNVRSVISREHGNDPRDFVEFHKSLRSKNKKMLETGRSCEGRSAPFDSSGRSRS